MKCVSHEGIVNTTPTLFVSSLPGGFCVTHLKDGEFSHVKATSKLPKITHDNPSRYLYTSVAGFAVASIAMDGDFLLAVLCLPDKVVMVSFPSRNWRMWASAASKHTPVWATALTKEMRHGGEIVHTSKTRSGSYCGSATQKNVKIAFDPSLNGDALEEYLRMPPWRRLEINAGFPWRCIGWPVRGEDRGIPGRFACVVDAVDHAVSQGIFVMAVRAIVTNSLLQTLKVGVELERGDHCVCTFIVERVSYEWRGIYMFRKMDTDEVDIYERYASAY